MTYSQQLKNKVITIYHNTKYSIRWLADLFKIGKSTICRWINGINKERRTTKRLSDVDWHEIKTYIEANPLVSLTELRIHIKNKLGKSVSNSTVSRTLKSLKLTRKKVRVVSHAKKEDAVVKFQSMMRTCQQSKIVCLDEVGFQLEYHRHYGWSKSGQRCCYRGKVRRQNYHGIFLITRDGQVCYKIYKTAITIDSFLSFLKQLDSCLCLGNELVLDNLRVHHNKTVVSTLQSKFTSIHWTPGYSPECNPIEIFFSGLKSFLRCRQVSSEKEIIGSIDDYIKSRPSGFYNNLYQHCW